MANIVIFVQKILFFYRRQIILNFESNKLSKEWNKIELNSMDENCKGLELILKTKYIYFLKSSTNFLFVVRSKNKKVSGAAGVAGAPRLAKMTITLRHAAVFYFSKSR